MKLSASIIRNLANLSLPGTKAHNKVMSYNRPSVEQVMQNEPSPRQSAVLILLFEKKSDWHIVLMKRNVYNGTHSGQISLPGGKKEKYDESLEITALRESHEEIGIRPDQIELITDISPIYIPPSNFIVKPFIGLAKNHLNFIPDPREVDKLIEMPVHYLLQDSSLIDAEVKLSGQLNGNIKVKAYNFQNDIIWGATAMILAEFAVLLKNVSKS